MRVVGLTVCRNEAGRYLHPFLAWCSTFLDEQFVFDDQSTDATRDVAAVYDHVTLGVRGTSVPSFADHEGAFRQAAWDLFVEAMRPDDDTWIVALDCDEFLVHDEIDERDGLRIEITLASTQNATSIRVPIPEVFALAADGHPLVRVDGFWSTIASPRVFRWQPGGAYEQKGDGVGAAPLYAYERPFLAWHNRLFLLHFGYLRPEDRISKHARYRGRAGHTSRHVESILAPAKLRRWDGHGVPIAHAV